MGGYRELGDMPITVDLPPLPDGPYGATKLMGERLGRSLARAFDLTFIALRLGWVQEGANRPDTLPDDWARPMWLSNADLVRLFDCAVEAELDDRAFVVVNGMSNNRGIALGPLRRRRAARLRPRGRRLRRGHLTEGPPVPEGPDTLPRKFMPGQPRRLAHTCWFLSRPDRAGTFWEAYESVRTEMLEAYARRSSVDHSRQRRPTLVRVGTAGRPGQAELEVPALKTSCSNSTRSPLAQRRSSS